MSKGYYPILLDVESRPVVVVGGGVIGLSIAWELSRHGVSVKVLEQSDFGREASWAGAGILPPGNPDVAVHPYDQLRGASCLLWPEWSGTLGELTGIDNGFRNCGGLEIRLAGPADQLDDLALALRFAASPDRITSFIGCSIDPTRDGIKRYTRFLKGLSGAITTQKIPRLVEGMQRAMGEQDVRVFGVPPDSRFACKLVAADYRLKRVAMGFERLPIKGLVNYMDLLAKADRSAVRRQHRFWFVATHDGISRSPDSRIWSFSGPCLAVRTAAAGSPGDDDKKASPIAKRMAANLTSRFPQLARRIPVFADLENLVRLTVASEIALHAPLAASQARWHSRVLIDPDRFRRRTSPAPRRVPSLASVRKGRGRNWVLSVSGGVKVEPPPVRRKDFGRIDRQLVRTKHHTPTSGSWWWD